MARPYAVRSSPPVVVVLRMPSGRLRLHRPGDVVLRGLERGDRPGLLRHRRQP